MQQNLNLLIEKGLETETYRQTIPTDLSFGAWADMEKSDAEICADMKRSRHFAKRELAL